MRMRGAVLILACLAIVAATGAYLIMRNGGDRAEFENMPRFTADNYKVGTRLLVDLPPWLEIQDEFPPIVEWEDIGRFMEYRRAEFDENWALAFPPIDSIYRNWGGWMVERVG